MASSKKPFDEGPDIGTHKRALGDEGNGVSGSIARLTFRKDHPTYTARKVAIMPYLVDEITPFLRLEVYDIVAGKGRRRFTIIPLAYFNYLSVEAGKLEDNPAVVDRYQSLGPPGIIPKVEHVPPKKTAHVFAMEMRYLRDFELQWHGNSYEDMNVSSRRALDHFAVKPHLIELDVAVLTFDWKLVQSVKRFKEVCNEMNTIRNGLKGYGLLWSHKPPKDASIAKRLDPKNQFSPLYNIIGPGKRQQDREDGRDSARKKYEGRSKAKLQIDDLRKLLSQYEAVEKRYEGHEEKSEEAAQEYVAAFRDVILMTVSYANED